MNNEHFHVLVPCADGSLALVSLADLSNVDATDDDLTDPETIDNLAIDTIDATYGDVREQVQRVHALSLSGDADAYWTSSR